MANGITKPESTEIDKARKALVTLANEGFIKFPIAPLYLGNFMTELAQEYVKLRNAKPEGDKIQLLKDAIENARSTTSNVMLNKDTSPSASIAVLSEVGGLFGKRSINKYLESLA